MEKNTLSSPPTNEKIRNKLRQKIRSARRELSTEQQNTDAKKLFSRLIAHPRVKNAKHIGISLAYDGEIDTFKFIKWCWKNKKNIYLPVVHPFSNGHLLFLEYTKNTEMTLNKYAIKEPKLDKLHACALKKLDLVFTPLVAFDRQGNRIGMGGGYYDRMLAPWFENQKGPYPIGLAHDCQHVQLIPIEKWDVPLPEIITPSNHYHW